MNMNEPPSLLRNDYRRRNGWLEVRLVGTRSNRAGLGATVVVTAGGRRQARAVLSQSSYYSHDDLRLHFGLGAARQGRRGRGALAERPGGRAKRRAGPARGHDPGRRRRRDRPRDLEGRRRTADSRPRAPRRSVLLFVSTDCPISNRYAPELRRLRERFAPRGRRLPARLPRSGGGRRGDPPPPAGVRPPDRRAPRPAARRWCRPRGVG